MQVETPKDIIGAYGTQVVWLETRLAEIKQQDPENATALGAVETELEWARNALSKIREVVSVPKGKLVQVVKTKVPSLRNKVGRVTYVNTDRGYATVSFDGATHAHSLSLKNLTVVDMPVPSTRVPSAGMVVKFKNDPEAYVAIQWSTDTVYVEPMSSVYSGKDEWYRCDARVRKLRTNVETIEGMPPL